MSGDPFPPKIQKCVDSWKKHLPEYELVLWNYDRFPRGASSWVDQAFDAKKYAFASDFLRFYAVFHHGGIYLDCDVEAVKNFDALLRLPYFISVENEADVTPEPAFFGAPKGCPWVGDCMDWYQNKNFARPDGTMDMTVLPVVMKKNVFAGRRMLKPVSGLDDIRSDADILFLLPREFSNSLNLVGKPPPITHAVHHYDSAWMPPRERTLNNIFKPVSKVLRILLGKSLFIKGRACFHRVLSRVLPG